MEAIYSPILLSLTFFTEPASIVLTSLHKTTPSFSTSKKLSMSPVVLMGSPVICFIHSKTSDACSSLYFELICKNYIKIEIELKHKLDNNLYTVGDINIFIAIILNCFCLFYLLKCFSFSIPPNRNIRMSVETMKINFKDRFSVVLSILITLDSTF